MYRKEKVEKYLENLEEIKIKIIKRRDNYGK